MSVSPQKHPASEAPAGPVPPAGGAHIAESLVLLSRDESLIEALAQVVPGDGLIVLADEAALTQQLMRDRAGVAFIDAAAVHPPRRQGRCSCSWACTGSCPMSSWSSPATARRRTNSRPS